MSIVVRYFANMRDRMGRAEEKVDVAGGLTVAELWRQVSQGQPMPPNILIAVNMEYTDADQIIKDGDEVAFFPPVTGG